MMLYSIGTDYDILRNLCTCSMCRSSDNAKVKDKMIYAGSKDALTRTLVGISIKVHATDLSELTEDIVIEACRKFA